jgi:hypothetical protein
MANPTSDGPVAKRYNKLVVQRTPYHDVAVASAKLSIPSVFPPETERATNQKTGSKVVVQAPSQNVGVRGVNNLASKLLLTLLPPNTPFFRFLLDEELEAEIAGDPALKADVESALQNMERQVMEEVETSQVRVDTFEAMRHSIITGNYLLFMPIEGPMKGWDLSEYVIRRDRRGTILEIVIREAVERASAEPRVRGIIEANKPKDDEVIFLYSSITLDSDGKRYTHKQEILGQPVKGAGGSWPKDKLPYIALRFRKIEGESYGRGLIEESIGDLKTLETLTRALTEGSAAAAKVLWGVRAGATTSAKTLAKLKNMDFFQGEPEDVWTLQLQKQADFQIAFQKAEEIKNDLRFIFLLNSAVQRQGERVTAEEIRFMAGELEDTLGGVYSILSQDFQRPLVDRLILRMESRGDLPQFQQGDLKTVIVTGIEAIGRGQDISKLRGFAEDVQVLAQINPGILKFVNERQMLLSIATARGIEVSDIIRTEEQVTQMQQAEQQAQLQAQAGQSAAQGLGKGAEQAAVNLANQALPGPEEGEPQ